jgi:hypothetical protein
MMLVHDKQHRMNSASDFFYPECHFKIDNTELSAVTVASLIADRFTLPRASSAGITGNDAS